MSHDPPRHVDHGAPIWQSSQPASIALAVAMGIGRFAFTPLLPLMLRTGSLCGAAGANGRQRIMPGIWSAPLRAESFAGSRDRGLLLGARSALA